MAQSKTNENYFLHVHALTQLIAAIQKQLVNECMETISGAFQFVHSSCPCFDLQCAFASVLRDKKTLDAGRSIGASVCV